MKKLFIAVAALFGLSIAPGVANAALSFNSSSSSCSPNCTGTITDTFNGGLMGLTDISNGNTLSLGELDSNGAPGTVVFTYIGKEAGDTNEFELTMGGGMEFNTASSTAGDHFTLDASTFPSGAVPVEFETLPGGTGTGEATNGGMWTNGTSIALIPQNTVNSGGTFGNGAVGHYDFILGFNDTGGGVTTQGDWDDLVIGVNFVSAVPEPEIYAMMGVGMLLMGFVARRRKL